MSSDIGLALNHWHQRLLSFDISAYSQAKQNLPKELQCHGYSTMFEPTVYFKWPFTV